jgi:hypothetical protein
VPYFDVPEPFRAFNVELHFDHPYWTVMKCDMNGPRFNNTHPDVSGYLRDYQRNIEELEKLVAAFRTVAFPDAPEFSAGPAAAGWQAVHTASHPCRRHRGNQEIQGAHGDGVITQQEFDAKKSSCSAYKKED